MKKRPVDLIVISDVHLGTYGSHAAELLLYLRSVEPKALIINGDLFDIWQFRKRFFPPTHFEVLKEIILLAAKKIPVYFLPGNHDDLLRKFGDFSIGNFHLINELVWKLGDKKAWILHGDKYDTTVKRQWLATLGGHIYECFILLERWVNKVLSVLRIKPLNVAKRIKAYSKSMAKSMNNFEQTAIEEGIRNGYDFVICGHVHKPQQRTVVTDLGSTVYLNSGDWVENLTALEYHHEKWTIFHFNAQSMPPQDPPIPNTKKDEKAVDSTTIKMHDFSFAN